MNSVRLLIAGFAFLLITTFTLAQQSSVPPASADNIASPAANASTVRGCLDGQRGNYILVENNTNMVYVLRGVGNKLDNLLHHEVEVKGRVLPGRIKTGVRPEKAGSNPSDTVHGVDGVPLQVVNVQTDMHTISKHCMAADHE